MFKNLFIDLGYKNPWRLMVF